MYVHAMHQEEVILKRQVKLDDYLKELLNLPEIHQNVHVLAFLGLMSTARQELVKYTPPQEAKPRQVRRRRR